MRNIYLLLVVLIWHDGLVNIVTVNVTVRCLQFMTLFAMIKLLDAGDCEAELLLECTYCIHAAVNLWLVSCLLLGLILFFSARRCST